MRRGKRAWSGSGDTSDGDGVICEPGGTAVLRVCRPRLGGVYSVEAEGDGVQLHNISQGVACAHGHGDFMSADQLGSTNIEPWRDKV